MTNKEEMEKLVSNFVDKVHQLYWEECERQQRAVDPSELTNESWVIRYLDSEFSLARRIEDTENSWEMAREFFS